MGVTIGAQTISIAASALCGLLAGLLYDLLRVVRRGGGRALGVICDLVFCLFCTGAMFLAGMVFCLCEESLLDMGRKEKRALVLMTVLIAAFALLDQKEGRRIYLAWTIGGLLLMDAVLLAAPALERRRNAVRGPLPDSGGGSLRLLGGDGGRR